MRAEVMTLQKALIALIATVGFDFGMDCQDVFRQVVFSGKLMRAHLAFKLFALFMH